MTLDSELAKKLNRRKELIGSGDDDDHGDPSTAVERRHYNDSNTPPPNHGPNGDSPNNRIINPINNSNNVSNPPPVPAKTVSPPPPPPPLKPLELLSISAAGEVEEEQEVGKLPPPPPVPAKTKTPLAQVNSFQSSTSGSSVSSITATSSSGCSAASSSVTMSPTQSDTSGLSSGSSSGGNSSNCMSPVSPKTAAPKTAPKPPLKPMSSVDDNHSFTTTDTDESGDLCHHGDIDGDVDDDVEHHAIVGSADEELKNRLNRQRQINDGQAVPGGPVQRHHHNVYVEFEEFSRKQIKSFEATFKKYDCDGDHKLDLTEVKRLMEGLGEAQTHLALKAMIAEVDEDADGCISFREFLLIFRKAIAGELAEGSGLHAIVADMGCVDVTKEGMGAAKNFFEAKINQLTQGSKFENEIKQEQAERKQAAEEAKERKAEFKKKLSNFTDV